MSRRRFATALPTFPAHVFSGGVSGPRIYWIAPTHGDDTGATSVTIHGVHFTDASVVKFDTTSAPSFTVVDDHTITAVSPAHAAGATLIHVTTPAGSDTFPYTFDSTGGSAPVLTSIDYDQGDVAGGGQSIVLTGSGFTGATSVDFGASTASFVVDNDNQITATLPAHAAGVVSLTVTGPGGTSGALSFEFWKPTQLSPTLFCRAPNYTDGGGAAGDWTDESSLATDLTAAGGATPSNGAAIGGYSPTANFDGANDALDSGWGWTSVITGNNLTLFALVNADTLGADPTLYAGKIFGDAGNAGIGLDLTASGASVTLLTNGPAYAYNQSPYVACGSGSWHLLLAMADSADTGNEGKIAVDGSGWTSFAAPGGWTPIGVGAVKVGVGYEGRYFDGRMAALGIINGTSLSADIIRLRKWANQHFGTSV